jgi:hypothetical protein
MSDSTGAFIRSRRPARCPANPDLRAPVLQFAPIVVNGVLAEVAKLKGN